MLVSTVLSHRTRDELTLRASLRLLARYSTPKKLAGAPVDMVTGLIRDAGFSRQKAVRLVQVAGELTNKFGGSVPRKSQELLSLTGIGRKTSEAVRVFGFQEDGIPVDSNIHRVVNRLGVVRTASALDTTAALKRTVPRKYWSILNPVLVQHGQNLCSTRNPKCAACPIAAWCDHVGVAPIEKTRPQNLRGERLAMPIVSRVKSDL